MKRAPLPTFASLFSQLEELDAIPLREFSKADRASTLASLQFILNIARQTAATNRTATLVRRGAA